MIVKGEPGQIRILDSENTEDYVFYGIEAKPGKEHFEYVTIYFWDKVEDELQTVLETYKEEGFEQIGHYPPTYHNSVSPYTLSLIHI